MKNPNRSSSRLPARRFLLLLLGATSLAVASIADADSIYSLSGRPPKPFPTPGVTITGIHKEAGQDFLDYTVNSSGTEKSKALKSIVQIEVEGETFFNQAEVEFVKGDFKAASADYQKAQKSASKPWMKIRIDRQMLELSSKTGDFAGAVTGFVELARSDPAAAGSQAPPIDKQTLKPDQLAQAITTVNAALANSKPATKQALYPFLASLYTATGQSAKADDAIKAGSDLGRGGDVVDTGSQLKAAEADSFLAKAKAAYTAKQYDQAIKMILGNGGAFVDRDRQATALFLVAQAREGLAEQTTGAGSQEAWEDAALAYMRVVAHFKATATPTAADALYKTAVIEEKLKRVPEALTLYNQVIRDFKDSKAAADAQAAVTRLGGAKG